MSLWDNVKKFAQPYTDDDYDDYDEDEEYADDDYDEPEEKPARRQAPARRSRPAAKAAEEIEDEVLHQHVALRVLPQVALEQEHRLLAHLALRMRHHARNHLDRLERLDRLVVQHAQLDHIKKLVVEEAAEDEILGSLLGVASHHKQTAVVLLAEELERVDVLEGTNIVLLRQ